MPTTVTKSIGTSARDYSTLQAWEDACPANLVTDDKIWRGEAYNDSEFFTNSSALLTVSGETTDATHYVELTAAAGQSFQDHASVRSNALTYDQAKGVGIRGTRSYSNPAFTTSSVYFRFSRLQFAGTGGVGPSAGVTTVKDCIFTNVGVGGGGGAVLVIINCAASLDSGSGGPFGTNGQGNLCIATTMVRTTNNGVAGTAWNQGYAGSNTTTFTSCACFGFSAIVTATGGNSASSYNATDAASGLPGSVGNQHSVTFNATTPFTQASNTGTDLRAIASTTLAGNGYLDSTNAPNDISGYARAATPTIGVWELSSGGGGGTGKPWLYYAQQQTMMSGAA